MYEYKTITVDTSQGWGGSKGTINSNELDVAINKVAAEGWRLKCLEDLEHTAGSKTLVCVFEREKTLN